MGERDDHVEPLSNEPAELVLGLRQPPCDERRPLGLERVRLPLRERIELGTTFERDSGEALVSPDRSHFVGLPDEVERGYEGSDEIGRDLDLSGLLVVRQRELAGAAASLRGRVDQGLVGLAERALGERRERSDALDLVAEKLDPEGLPTRGREDVDEPAAHRDLASLLDTVDPVVAGGDERLGDRVDAGLVAPGEPKRRRPELRRRHAARQRRAPMRRRGRPRARTSSARARSPTR